MTKRKKKKIRTRRRILFIIIIVFAYFIFFKDKIININNNKSYSNNIVNNSNEVIQEEWQSVILKYLDLYTDSLVNLKSRDITSLFTLSNSTESYLTQSTIDLQVMHHSIQPTNLSLNKAYYDITYTNVIEDDNKVTIDFLENDYYNFSNLKDIISRIIDVENTIVLKKVNNEYKIESIRIERDNYVIFTSVLKEGFTKSDIDILKDKYIKYINDEVKKNNELLIEANKTKYNRVKSCDHSYNRKDAVNYSYKYVDDRNTLYGDYSLLGGNCANFASQSIHAGGIPMDYIGNYHWKYYGDVVDDSNTRRGRSSSWVSTYYFYDYAKNNKDYGMCADVDVNLFYAEEGDVIHVGYKDDIEYSHTTLVSKVINNDNSIYILVNSNTTGLKDYPVLGYIYQNKRLIKILGYND